MKIPIISAPASQPLINDCLLCARCNTTFRVLQKVPHLSVTETRDRECDADAQLSHCPRCMPGSGETAIITRPVASRLRMREIIVELLGYLERERTPPAPSTHDAGAANPTVTLRQALAEALSRRKNYAASRPPIQLDLLDLWIIDTFEVDIPEIEGPTVEASGLVAFYKGPAMSPQDARAYAKRILIAADDADAVTARVAEPPATDAPARIAAIRAELGLVAS